MAAEPTKGLIYVGHLPHGFYEAELKAYFSQFGKVTNVRVNRSRKTGRSKGYGFVEFAHAEVAAIAAETMDNYLMFKRRLIANAVPPGKLKQAFKGKPWTTRDYPAKMKRANEARRQNRNRSRPHGKLREKVNTKLAKLRALGIQHSVKVDCNENVR